MELTCTQFSHMGAIEFGQLRQNHRMDWHIDAHAKRVGAADDG